MEEVTLVNRTEETLIGVHNSIEVEIPPGEMKLPLEVAVLYRNQNPVMGTLDPDTMIRTNKLGIKEIGDDVSPLTNVKETDELVNRELVGEEVVVKKLPRGLYGSRRGPDNVDGMFGDV